MSTEILEGCFESNQDDAQLLLLREIPEYGKKSPLKVAVLADCKEFVSSQCSQSLLVKTWYGQIIPDTSRFFVIEIIFLNKFFGLVLKKRFLF